MKKHAIIAAAAAAVLATTGAGAATHWFGLGSPGLTPQTIRLCNADFRTENDWLKMAQAALANLDPATADTYLARSRAAARDLKAHGCPDGPYPLRNNA